MSSRIVGWAGHVINNVYQNIGRRLSSDDHPSGGPRMAASALNTDLPLTDTTCHQTGQPAPQQAADSNKSKAEAHRDADREPRQKKRKRRKHKSRNKDKHQETSLKKSKKRHIRAFSISSTEELPEVLADQRRTIDLCSSESETGQYGSDSDIELISCPAAKASTSSLSQQTAAPTSQQTSLADPSQDTDMVTTRSATDKKPSVPPASKGQQQHQHQQQQAHPKQEAPASTPYSPSRRQLDRATSVRGRQSTPTTSSAASASTFKSPLKQTLRRSPSKRSATPQQNNERMQGTLIVTPTKVTFSPAPAAGPSTGGASNAAFLSPNAYRSSPTPEDASPHPKKKPTSRKSAGVPAFKPRLESNGDDWSPGRAFSVEIEPQPGPSTSKAPAVPSDTADTRASNKRKFTSDEPSSAEKQRKHPSGSPTPRPSSPPPPSPKPKPKPPAPKTARLPGESTADWVHRMRQIRSDAAAAAKAPEDKPEEGHEMRRLDSESEESDRDAADELPDDSEILKAHVSNKKKKEQDSTKANEPSYDDLPELQVPDVDLKTINRQAAKDLSAFEENVQWGSGADGNLTLRELAKRHQAKLKKGYKTNKEINDILNRQGDDGDEELTLESLLNPNADKKKKLGRADRAALRQKLNSITGLSAEEKKNILDNGGLGDALETEKFELRCREYGQRCFWSCGPADLPAHDKFSGWTPPDGAPPVATFYAEQLLSQDASDKCKSALMLRHVLLTREEAEMLLPPLFRLIGDAQASSQASAVASRLAAHVVEQLYSAGAAAPLEWSAVASAFQQLGAHDFEKSDDSSESATQVDKGKAKAADEEELDDHEPNDEEADLTDPSGDKRIETVLRLVRFIESVSQAGPWNHDEGVQFVVKCNVLLFRLTVDPASAGPLSTACSSAIRAFFANQVANNERVMAQTFEALRKIPQGWSYRTKYHLLGQVPQEFNAGLRLKRWLAYSWLGIDGDSNQADLSAMPSISKVIAFVHDCHDSKQHALWPKEDRPASELVAAIALLSVILLDPPVQTKEDREKLKPIPVVLERYDGMIYSTVREDPERHRAKNAVTRLTHLIGYQLAAAQKPKGTGPKMGPKFGQTSMKSFFTPDAPQ